MCIYWTMLHFLLFIYVSRVQWVICLYELYVSRILKCNKKFIFIKYVLRLVVFRVSKVFVFVAFCHSAL